MAADTTMDIQWQTTTLGSIPVTSFRKTTVSLDLNKTWKTSPFSVDSVEPRVLRVLEKVSSTIDKNEERCEENDRKEQHELEWKQVALVIGTTSNSIENNLFSRHIKFPLLWLLTLSVELMLILTGPDRV